MKKMYQIMISVIVILALVLLVVSCKSTPKVDASETAASSEEAQVSEGLGEVDDLEQLEKELNEVDDAGLDELEIE